MDGELIQGAKVVATTSDEQGNYKLLLPDGSCYLVIVSSTVELGAVTEQR